MNIREKRPGYFEIAWREPDGTRKSHGMRGTYADALAWWESRSASPTFAGYWASTVRPSCTDLKPKTLYEYDRLWGVLEPLCGLARLDAATHSDAQSWTAQIGSPSVQRHAAALLRKICRMAVRDGLMAHDITDGLRYSRHRRQARRILDPCECYAFLDMLDGFQHAFRFAAMLGCGLSPSEAYALTPADVRRLDDTHIMLSISKTAVDIAGRTHVNDTPKTEFRERIVVMGEPFSRRVPPSMPPLGNVSSAMTSWRRWLLRRSWGHVQPSDLRATFSTWCRDAGLSEDAIAKAMGHAGATTAGIHYQRATVRNSMRVADALADYVQVCNQWVASSILVAGTSIDQAGRVFADDGRALPFETDTDGHPTDTYDILSRG